jgi:hypothetical protein
MEEMSVFEYDIWTCYSMIFESDFHPDDNQLGLLNAIMGAGSLVAIPVVPYAADYLSRRGGILTGCLLM